MEPVPGKVVFEMQEGDVLTIETGGGGGYGDPLERDPEAVLRDWSEGKVTLAQAQAAYGVVIDEKTRSLDHEATTALRAQRREQHNDHTHTVDRGNAELENGKHSSDRSPQPAPARSPARESVGFQCPAS